MTNDLESKCLKKLLDCIHDVSDATIQDSLTEEEQQAMFDRIAYEAIAKLLQWSSGYSMRLVVGKQAIDVRGGFVGTTLHKTPAKTAKQESGVA